MSGGHGLCSHREASIGVLRLFVASVWARRIACALWLLALTESAARAEDWPQFRGPTGQGHSTERGVPVEWSESKNIIWTAPVPGRGWASPVVAGGRVWVTTATKGSGASLRAL